MRCLIYQKWYTVDTKTKFFKLRLPKPKPMSDCIYLTNVYQKLLNKNFFPINIDLKYIYIYILGNFNINVYEKNKYVVNGNNTAQILDRLMLKYHQFSARHISNWSKSPTRVTCSTSTLTDHILASFHSIVSQEGFINIGLLISSLFFHMKNF